MQRRAVCCLLILLVFFLNVAGCSEWSLSDDEAVMLVKEYYLFFYNGKEVDAKIISRGTYIEENKCYPIEFLIVPLGQTSFKKTFFFFKDVQGRVAIREFQVGQKASS